MVFVLPSLRQTKDFAYLLACCEVAEKFGQPIRLNFHLRLTETTSAVWETVFWHKRLYVAFENSCGSIPQASKEAFVSLLEFAEDQLACTHVIVCLRKNSSLRGSFDVCILINDFAGMIQFGTNPRCSLFSFHDEDLHVPRFRRPSTDARTVPSHDRPCLHALHVRVSSQGYVKSKSLTL